MQVEMRLHLLNAAACLFLLCVCISPGIEQFVLLQWTFVRCKGLHFVHCHLLLLLESRTEQLHAWDRTTIQMEMLLWYYYKSQEISFDITRNDNPLTILTSLLFAALKIKRTHCFCKVSSSSWRGAFSEIGHVGFWCNWRLFHNSSFLSTLHTDCNTIQSIFSFSGLLGEVTYQWMITVLKFIIFRRKWSALCPFSWWWRC